MDGAATACTEMACFTSTPPYCTAYADGRECTDATTCMIVDSVGAEAPDSSAVQSSCSTTPLRGQPNGPPDRGPYRHFLAGRSLSVGQLIRRK
jgi:hypothetical protein